MRELPKDILKEMKTRFDSDFHIAYNILIEFVSNNKYLDSDRVIRCVIYLTKNGLENWTTNLNFAKRDPRDVMYWAEYEGDFKKHQVDRVRDFNKTFFENEL